MTSQPALAPTQERQRYLILDALRGFALLGICMANLPEFALWIFMSAADQQAIPHAGADPLVRFLQFFFIDAKFYTIFSLLFGIGFSLILERALAKGVAGVRLFYRRMLLLVLIGLLHIWLLWSGDILLLYACMGLLLPLFAGCSDRRLLQWAAFLLLLPIVLDAVGDVSGIDWGKPLEALWWQTAHAHGIDEQNFSTYLRDADSYAAVFQFLIQGFVERMWEFVEGHRVPKVLAFFLLGYVAGRRRWYARVAEWQCPSRFWQAVWLFVSLSFSWLYAWSALNGHPLGRAVHGVFYLLSALSMSGIYIVLFCRLQQRCPSSPVLRWLAAPGRMALSNYMGQSIVGILLFYGIGLGLGNRFSLLFVELTAVGIFIVQVVLSTCWLSSFRFGPLEWVWRMLTYGKWLSLRKEPD